MAVMTEHSGKLPKDLDNTDGIRRGHVDNQVIRFEGSFDRSNTERALLRSCQDFTVQFVCVLS